MRTEEAALPAIDLFHKRMGFRRWAILSQSDIMDYSVSVVNAIESNYKELTKEPMNIVVRRCESQKSNISAPNCESVSDCSNGEDCVVPVIDIVYSYYSKYISNYL